jgi:hypothetical protein
MLRSGSRGRGDQKDDPDCCQAECNCRQGQQHVDCRVRAVKLAAQTAKSPILQSWNDVLPGGLWWGIWCLLQTRDSDQGSKTATSSNTLTMANGSPMSFRRSNKIHAARANQATRPIAAP